ncbi:ABC transporter permease [Neotabrizicola shimadae]|uniref:ABC transporter permease subunit n=1 Tax=Neotabrizicola shimadae TaxID=2807096 RepID=A0A8G0ZTY5_9RHOB|nr:ABC transporter permease subunit [Neotabrizicola shimadae]QYZ70022.1 ABC transporter permease subunit [Neotabrizicola shimadae]
MKRRVSVGSVLIVVAAALYFLVPLYAAFQFSLQMKRGELSLAAYRALFDSDVFLNALTFSLIASAAAIVVGAILVVPTIYWVRLRLPRLRPVIEFISLLPLIIPSVVLVFGQIRMFGSSSILPLTTSDLGTNFLLVAGYVVLSMPYMFRAVDNGLAAIDIATLTEAGESLGASRLRIVGTIIFPNIRGAIISGAFLTLSICLGEFAIASLLNRQAFGPYMVQLGQDRAYEPAALAIMSFALTWVLMALMQAFGTMKPGQRLLPRFRSARNNGEKA